jgi:hypothetical protein
MPTLLSRSSNPLVTSAPKDRQILQNMNLEQKLQVVESAIHRNQSLASSSLNQHESSITQLVRTSKSQHPTLRSARTDIFRAHLEAKIAAALGGASFCGTGRRGKEGRGRVVIVRLSIPVSQWHVGHRPAVVAQRRSGSAADTGLSVTGRPAPLSNFWLSGASRRPPSAHRLYVGLSSTFRR